MSPTARIRLLVAVAAVAAAGVVAGVVYATRQDPAQPKALCKHTPSAVVVPGVTTRHASDVRAALKLPPSAAARVLEPVADANPKDPVVQLNYGSALACAGYVAEAAQAWRRAKAAGRDTYYEVAADNLLHPQFYNGGYPPFEYFGHDPLLVQGQIEQRGFHQHSAERLWARAAALHPNDDQAQVAAAVGRFDMDNLVASFSRLGPLVRRFPHSQSVRFHLGLLLVWTGQAKQATQELELAHRYGPSTQMGKDAAKLLRSLVASGTKGSKR